VKRHAIVELGLKEGDYPHPATIYRVLQPLIEHQNRKKRVRNPGSGSWLAVETRTGQLLKAEFSNQIVQCDHTKLDIRIVGSDGVLLPERPWLTTVVDTFSSCVIGYHLWRKQPGSDEVALALRRAMSPKNYPSEYELEKPWQVCGCPLQYFFTDGGKDFRSKHLKAIGKKLGFQCELRDRPPQGGIVERVFKTINTQVLKGLPGYTGSNVQERPEQAEKEACLTIHDLDKILAGFFCDDYNHQPYPKDPRDTRFERWFKGMGGKLPEVPDERELDICLMKEAQRVVQAHGSVQFENLTYRGECLRQHGGKYVTLRYDPDHILTLFVYSQETDDNLGDFLGYVHAINLDTQDLSLDELKRLNKERSKARKEHSNYDALLALGKRNKLAEERKQDKKDRQRTEQRQLRQSSKKDSNVVKLRQQRASTSSKKDEPLEILPERISREQIKPQQPEPQPEETLPSTSTSDAQEQERHRLVISNRKSKLKGIW
jgi:putative transposase